MATITVETGTGSASSNSYISTTDFETYAADRGIDLVGTSADLLIKAMDYIESNNFKGDKSSSDQALQWPRINFSLDGYVIASDSIPVLLKDALCETAIGIDAGNDPLLPEERATKTESVGDISVTYMDDSRNFTYLKTVDAKLSKLINQSLRSYRV